MAKRGIHVCADIHVHLLVRSAFPESRRLERYKLLNISRCIAGIHQLAMVCMLHCMCAMLNFDEVYMQRCKTMAM